MTRRFVAPGKVVLVGEYAVLDGAPAIVAAVNAGVSCEVTRASDLQIVVPGDDNRFAAAALKEVDAPPACYRFGDWNRPATATKAGLGGSAAATVVAMVAASALRGPELSPQRLCAAAIRVHHAVQGSGSGVDVAAAAYGGVLRFLQGAATPISPVKPLVIWSGTSAKTGPRVSRYQQWVDRDAFVRRSGELVDAFPSDPVRVLGQAGELLTEMAASAGLDYLTPGLARIQELAHSHGGAAKPSGAGGGDCAVALFECSDAQAAFARACEAASLHVLPLQLAAGAREITHPSDQRL